MNYSSNRIWKKKALRIKGQNAEPVQQYYPQPFDIENGRMSFGMWKGYPYTSSAIPPSYLKWILRNWENLNGYHRKLITQHLEHPFR